MEPSRPRRRATSPQWWCWGAVRWCSGLGCSRRVSEGSVALRALLGYALYCAGGATAAFAAGRYAMGEWRQEDARRAWNDAEAQAVVALARRESALENPASA